MGPSRTSRSDLVSQVKESVRQFWTVFVVAVGLACALSFLGSLLANQVLGTDWVQDWHVWAVCAFIALLMVLLLGLLWRFTVPPTSYQQGVRLRLILNERKEEILWFPSWTYMAGAIAHQVCEVLQKRDLFASVGLRNQEYPRRTTWIEDLPGYLVLQWLSGSGVDVRPTGMRLRPVELSDFPAWMGRDNQLVELISKLGTPSGFIETALSRLTVELPKGFRIWALADEQEATGVLNWRGIAIGNWYCRVEISTGPMFPTKPSVIRTGPAPSIDGMPINAAPPEYYLQQLHDIAVASWPMTFTIQYSAGMLLFRPRKAQRSIEYLSKMADAFVDYFDWDSALAGARAWEEKRTYDVLMEIQADTNYIKQKVDRQDG